MYRCRALGRQDQKDEVWAPHSDHQNHKVAQSGRAEGSSLKAEQRYSCVQETPGSPVTSKGAWMVLSQSPGKRTVDALAPQSGKEGVCCCGQQGGHP